MEETISSSIREFPLEHIEYGFFFIFRLATKQKEACIVSIKEEERDDILKSTHFPRAIQIRERSEVVEVFTENDDIMRSTPRSRPLLRV